MPTLRDQFDAMVAVFTEVQAELHAVADQADVSPSIQRACELALPAIAAQWQGLRHAKRVGGWSTPDLALLIENLHRDLVLLRLVLRGDIGLSDQQNN